jgi:hypothetical protein
MVDGQAGHRQMNFLRQWRKEPTEEVSPNLLAAVFAVNLASVITLILRLIFS